MSQNPHENPVDTFWHRRFGPRLGGVALFVLEVLQIIVVAAAIVIPIRYFLIYPFVVKGESMEPNFHNNEYLIIDELSYRFREPERGEIVVFRYPRDPSEFFIKRIIGLPGETVEVRDGKVFVSNDEFPNGKELEESYLVEPSTNRTKRTMGEKEYFVMGDNRDESLDSRSFGPIGKDAIVGRVWIRGLPFSRFSLFPPPAYNLP
jgi:signal peptidase I